MCSGLCPKGILNIFEHLGTQGGNPPDTLAGLCTNLGALYYIYGWFGTFETFSTLVKVDKIVTKFYKNVVGNVCKILPEMS